MPHLSQTEKATEMGLRRKASSQGFALIKSRKRTLDFNNQGGFMIINADRNVVVIGEKFELGLNDVAEYLASQHL